MKKGWQTKCLGDVTTKIGSGATPRGGDESYKAEGISLIRSLNVYDDGFREAKLARIDEEQADDLSNAAVEPHDVLLNITGASVARCCRAPADFLPARVNQHVSIIRPSQEKLDPDFLHYLLISKIYKDRLLHTGEEGGSTRQAITKGQLQEFVVEFPESLAEQRRIVAILDEAFEAIAIAKANAEKNLRNARELFEGHLRAVFTQRGPGWADKQLEDCIEDVRYPAKVQRKHFLEEGEFPVVSQEAEFINGFWDNAEDVFRVAKPVVVFGDHTRVFKYIDFDFVLGADGVKLLSPKSFMNPKYFFYALRSAPLKSLGYARHYRLLKELQVSYPDTSEQVEIARKIEVLEEKTQCLSLIFERKIAALEELRKSLLHQAFTGALTDKKAEKMVAETV